MNPEAAALFIRDYGDVLDFVIGSIHNMEKDLDVYYYDFTKSMWRKCMIIMWTGC